MSDIPKFNEREIHDATPELMRKELDKYFAHVQGHDPKDLEFALMVTGHSEEGGTHVCSMLGGPPITLAQVIVDLMNELVQRDRAFATFFTINFLHRVYGRQGADKPDFDATGGPDVEAQVKDMLDKLQGNTPPDGSIH